MSILDRYILIRFVKALLMVSISFGFLTVAINMVEELRDFVDHDVPLKDIFTYYIYFAGWVLTSFLPIFVFLAGLFTVGSLARSNELDAIRSSGVSVGRFAAPLVLAACLISVGHFYYNEYIYPPANRIRIELKEYTIKKRSRAHAINRYNLYRQVSDSVFYVIDKYNAPDRLAEGVKIYFRDGAKLSKFISAETMTYNKGVWTLKNATLRTFSETEEDYQEMDTLQAPYIRDAPSELERRLGKPEDMSYAELEDYIALMKRSGGEYLAELVDLKFKLSFPVVSIIVMLLCIPLAVNQKKGGVAFSLSMASGFILIYLVSFKICKALGAHGVIEPDIAAWSVNGSFALIALVLISGMRK